MSTSGEACQRFPVLSARLTAGPRPHEGDRHVLWFEHVGTWDGATVTAVIDALVRVARSAAPGGGPDGHGTNRLVARLQDSAAACATDPLVAAAREAHEDPYGQALALGVAMRLGSGEDDHLACPVVAAAVTAADRWPPSVPLGAAVAGGLDVAALLRGRLGPGHAARWDVSGTCGVVAAAAAVALVLGADDDGLATATALATSQLSGHGVARGTQVEALTAGRAAANGVLSAVLAVSGFTASPTAVDGPEGLLAVLGKT